MAVADDRDPDGFTVVRHGYDRTQVRQRVAELAEAAEKASRSMRDRYRALLASLDEQHTELARTHKSMMASTKAQVEEMTTEAERRREAIDKDAEQDRIRIDREFSESMSAKREALK